MIKEKEKQRIREGKKEEDGQRGTHVHNVPAAIKHRNTPPSNHPAWAAAIGIASNPVPIRSPRTFNNYHISPHPDP